MVTMEKHRILVVDDDIDFVDWLRMELEAAGHQVDCAATVGEAETALAASRPDLAIVDLMIERPDDGFVLCHHIKKRDASIPVIMVTNVAGDSGYAFNVTTRHERSWIKADVVLDKPVRFEQLEHEIARLLESEK